MGSVTDTAAPVPAGDADAAAPSAMPEVVDQVALARLYGDAASLTLEPAEPHGVVVTMTLPWRPAAAPEDEVAYALHVPDRR